MTIYGSFLKSAIQKIIGIKRAKSSLGLPGAVRLFRCEYQAGKESPLRVNGLQHPIVLRGGTTDAWVFYQIIICHEYPIFRHYQPETILDAGANIGTASLHFLRHYPGASILALEPDPENYALLQRNLRLYPKPLVLPYALWYANETLHISDETDEKYAMRIESGSGKTNIDGKSIPWVLEYTGWDRINLLKIDIEGAEWELFGNARPDWLDRVDVIMIEMHEEIKPGCSKRFFDALGFDYRLKLHGGNLIVCRESFIQDILRPQNQSSPHHFWNDIFK